MADGFDKLAAYGRVAGAWRWLIDTDNNGVPNLVVTDPANVNGIPVAGNFDGNAANGDEVGVFTGSVWYFDTNHDFRVNSSLASNMIGYPIVGDFDGDGIDDLGTWADDLFTLDLSSTDGVIDGQADHQFRFGFIGVRERPVAADMDADGIDDLGLWVPDRGGATPQEYAEWYILVSDGASIVERIVPNPQGGGFVVDFTPVPFGNDLFAQFGDEFGLPVVGNFDPPVVAQDPPDYDFLSFQNPLNRYDVNGDGITSPIDALLVINALNRDGSLALPLIRSEATAVYAPFVDTSGDFYLSPVDALMVINALNSGVGGEGEGAAAGEGEAAVLVAASSRYSVLPALDIGIVQAATARVTPSDVASDVERPVPAVPAAENDSAAELLLPVAVETTPTPAVDLGDLATQDEALDQLISQLADDIDEQWNYYDGDDE